LANFCVEIDVDSDLYKVDAEKMVVEKANRLLDQSVPQGVSLNGKWRLDAFLEQWKQSLPEELRHAVSEEKLQGLALLEKPASAAGTDTSSLTVLRPLFAKKIPRDPQERFKHLWGVKPKWTLAELKPYLTPTQEMTVEAQLLKFTRVTQPNAKATAVYSKRQR
jgi:sister chromatid cohesion protein DCC1